MLDSYRDLIDSLLDTPTVLRELIDASAATESSELDRLLHEARVREAVNLRRAQSVMRDTQTMLRAIEDEPEVAVGIRTNWTGGDPENDLAGFTLDRGELISLLVNLTLKDWERPVDHDRSGDTTLADEIDDHLTWDEDIVARIRAVV